MPRAFLITNRRYNSAVDYEENCPSRETSPERGVSTAEEPTSHNDDETCRNMSFKPTSPKSPAHESRGSPSRECDSETPNQPLGLTVIRTTGRPNCARRNLTDQINAVTSSPGPSHTPPITAPSMGILRTSSPAAASLVTVIHHLMHQQQQATVISKVLANECTEGAHPPTDQHECPECGKRYSTSSNLARHRQTHRSVTDKKARKCPHCEKVYVSMPAYSMHVRTHSQGCQCPYCGKSFSRPWLLQGHIRTHTGEKPFSCPVCHKAFADKSNLRAHIQTHSSSKPYVCQRCGKAFALKSYLYKHEESSCMRLHRQQERATKEGLLRQEPPDIMVA